MAFKSFRDFEQYPVVLETDYLVGYREVDKEFKIPIGDINNFLAKSAVTAPFVLYVNLSGLDTNSGESEGTAFRTIKRACAKALWISRNLSPLEQQVENATGAYGLLSKSVNIFVRAGTYVEDNPVYLPAGCTLIGDNLRAVSVIPKNKHYDIIWTNSRCYVWGFTFRQHKKPAYSVAYPIFLYLSGGQDPVGQASIFRRKIGGVMRNYYENNTRVREATAASTLFYRLCGSDAVIRGGVDYSVTRLIGTNPRILIEDTDYPARGQDVVTPFEIAFLRRYFDNLENIVFFTQDEREDGEFPFWQTLWYRRNIRRPYTLTSPYTQGGSSITRSSEPGRDDAGAGILVDGYDVDGPLRSMVMDSFTQFNEGGKGIHIINNGYAQLVSTFTICCTEGIMCETGGTCSINTSNCSFGLSGLVATGKSPAPTLVGKLKNSVATSTNQMVFHWLGTPQSLQSQEFPTEIQPYPGQVFEIVDRSQLNTTASGFLTARNSNSYFSILTASPVFKPDPNEPYWTCVVQLETNYSLKDDTSFNRSQFDEITRLNGANDQGFAGSDVYFYIRSTITTSAHTMEYIGTGSTLLQAIPQSGGITDVSKEVVFDDVGKVFFTTTNQFGDFKIGPGLTIVQATGTIEGDTFKRSILQIITPFTIALSN